MTGVDTNVLIRYFLDDDPSQADRVEAFIRECAAKGDQVFVSCVVLCEFAWTLRSAFRKRDAEVLRWIEELLDSEPFVVERDDAVRSALHWARSSKGDFPDYLIAQIAVENGCEFTVTFDRALHADATFRKL